MPPQPVPGSTEAFGDRMARPHDSSRPDEPCGLAATTTYPAPARSWNSSNHLSPYCDIGPPWTARSSGHRSVPTGSHPSGVISQASMSPSPAGEGTSNRCTGRGGTSSRNAAVKVVRTPPTSSSGSCAGSVATVASTPLAASKPVNARSPSNTRSGSLPAPPASRRQMTTRPRSSPPTSTAPSPSHTGDRSPGNGAKVRSIVGREVDGGAGGHVDDHGSGVVPAGADLAGQGGDPGAVGRPRRVRPRQGAVGQPPGLRRLVARRIGVDQPQVDDLVEVPAVVAAGRHHDGSTVGRPPGAAVIEGTGGDGAGLARCVGRSDVEVAPAVDRPPFVVDAGDQRGDATRRVVAILGARRHLVDPGAPRQAAAIGRPGERGDVLRRRRHDDRLAGTVDREHEHRVPPLLTLAVAAGEREAGAVGRPSGLAVGVVTGGDGPTLARAGGHQPDRRSVAVGFEIDPADDDGHRGAVRRDRGVGHRDDLGEILWLHRPS